MTTNARLIAAAPELLAACEAICEFWDEAAADANRSTPLSPDALIGGHDSDELITIHDLLQRVTEKAR